MAEKKRSTYRIRGSKQPEYEPQGIRPLPPRNLIKRPMREPPMKRVKE